MATIIDRRKNSKNKSIHNRKKFIDRYKRQIKEQVDRAAGKRKIKDLAEEEQVTVTDTQEPTFSHGQGGDTTTVNPGNKHFNKGDKSPKPDKGEQGSGTQGGEGEDEFTFTLTREEFINIYFDGLELPNFLKKSMKNTKEYKYKRAGYCTEGPYPKLDLKKTFEQSIARRIANKREGHKPKFLDDVDLRYRLFTKQPQPNKTAVMFCLMDVSGSVTQVQKQMTKQFFFLLHVFLTTKYDKVTLRFIRYHGTARECSEHDFFYARDTGGTNVPEAFRVLLACIKEYNLEETNIYVCHSSDGDYYETTEEESTILSCMETLTKLCQYYIYIQVIDDDTKYNWKWRNPEAGLYNLFKYHLEAPNYTGVVVENNSILEAFKEVFRKK